MNIEKYKKFRCESQRAAKYKGFAVFVMFEFCSCFVIFFVSYE